MFALSEKTFYIMNVFQTVSILASKSGEHCWSTLYYLNFDMMQIILPFSNLLFYMRVDISPQNTDSSTFSFPIPEFKDDHLFAKLLSKINKAGHQLK